MNPGFAPSSYVPGVSYAQESNPILIQHRTSFDNALSSANSTSSLDDPRIPSESMTRTVSDNGTLGSWQLVSPSPSADSPELERPMPCSPLHGSGQNFQDNGFTDDEFFMLSQVSHPSARELEPRVPVWHDQPMEDMDMLQFELRMNALASTSGPTTIRGLPGNEGPWSHYTHQRIVPTTTQELLATAMSFAPPTYAPPIMQQLPTSSPLDHPVSFEQVQMFDNSQSFLPDYTDPRHRSRSSSHSHAAILTPPPMPMDTSYSSSQLQQRLLHLSTEPSDLSQSLVAHNGSEKETASSPSCSSEYVMVESIEPSESTSRGRRRRPRIDTTFTHPSRQSHGKFLNFSIPSNRNGAPSQTKVSKNTIRGARGGRKRNSHLPTKTANGAREMREIKACWICALQRDVCTAGEICTRCVKRHDRGVIDANHGIGCVREKLFDYMEHFIPQHMNAVYDEVQLRNFAAAHIGRFSQAPIRIEIQPISGLPNIHCELFEFEPKDTRLLTQHQYWQNPHTRQFELVECVSAPVSFKSIGTNANEEQAYEKYVSSLAGNVKHMGHFASNVAFLDQDNPFLANILTALVDFQPQSRAQSDFIASVNKLLVTSYIFTRGCWIPGKEHHKLERLRFFQENPGFSFRTLPRMASRQFKHTFLRLLTKALDTVLRRLDRVFRSSQGSKEWVMAFYGILGLAMAFENMQTMVRAVLHSEVSRKMALYTMAKAELDFIIGKIDEKFAFMSKLFRLKYNRSFNPVVNLECRERLEAHESQLVSRITNLLNENWEFACQRQHGQPSLEKSDMYCGRLVSQFLCSVSPP